MSQSPERSLLSLRCTQSLPANCTSVTDFDDCPGNTTGFCPENIVCTCKDGEPFCKGQKSLSGLQLQHNSAYTFDTAMRPSQPDQGQKPWSPSLQSVLPRSPISPPPQFSGRNYNFMIHEPKDVNPYINPSYNWDSSLETAKSEAYYGNKYSSTMHMKPFFSSSTPGVPKSSHIQRERQQIGYPSSEEPEIPYRIGRAKMKFNY
uniref:Uncharacterized protein n=1 Tax=Equus caballus TaxID=9796 RepID=A0A9L0RB83_HORSE